MIKKSVVKYSNGTDCELEQSSDDGTFSLWLANKDSMVKTTLEDLYKFLGEVLQDLGSDVQKFSPTPVPAEKPVLAPLSNKFASNPDGVRGFDL